ncbi:SGNH/GDSL hydrolase family protein [Piscinibacter sp.]|jgi:outer membrane lipase/esterase|uniref:SGNH/GDSL hydrolase family protein n=1 Tax=Piscinibacter sp. TaxID=1903157 RepID=UPI00355A2F20
MKYTKSWGMSLVAALLLAACGGGGSDTTPRAHITSVKVMGDSLADGGTFGFKFTVQGTASLIYPEIIARSYSINSLCSFFLFTGTTFIANPTAGCTNYAIGGGRINNPTAPTSPQSIVVQLQTASAAANYSASDLLVIDGGGNDAADLVGAYLTAATDGGAAYSALLVTQLSPTVVATNLGAGPSGFAAVGGLYMTALADTFYNAIKTTALDKGATHVAVVNIPSITKTPRFQMVLDSIAAANGANGAAARAAAEAVFDSWITAFNTELATKFAGNSNVVVVDADSAIDDGVAHPAQYGLTNVTTPACPITGVGSDGLPTYTFPTCTDAALSAAPPTGVTGVDWWKTYFFSDSFHPTPLGHQILGGLISRSLAIAGWL